jgi:hypothetical protein
MEYQTMLYRNNVPETTIWVTGRNLAHKRRLTVERAFLGADLHLNRTALIFPTMTQAAKLVGTCVPYIAAAVAIAEDPARRDAVLAGERPLLGDHLETLAERFARSTRTERLKAAQAIGPGVIWDEMISPLV